MKDTDLVRKLLVVRYTPTVMFRRLVSGRNFHAVLPHTGFPDVSRIATPAPRNPSKVRQVENETVLIINELEDVA